jgi:hypothetical protein
MKKPPLSMDARNNFTILAQPQSGALVLAATGLGDIQRNGLHFGFAKQTLK